MTEPTTQPSQAPQADELGALVRLGFGELAAAVGGIRSMQNGAAGRAFGALAPVARAVEWSHETISAAAYGAVGASFRALGEVSARALARGGAAGDALSTTTPGSILLGALNGLIGDALERESSPLRQPMSVRVDGEPVPPEPDPLAAAFSPASGRLAVFIHGLMETEHAWQLDAHQRGGTYGSRLEADLGFTPVYLRYNSGRHISENGRSLAELLEAVVGAWPAEVREIALIGHSMGGLIARSGAQQAREERMAWPGRVRHLVSLGTPHLGAPLAQAVHHTSAALWGLPETRPFGSLLRRRSAGIRDLRAGSLVDEDWRGRDPDALEAAVCREVPLLDGAIHCFVAATMTRSERHPLGRLLGDSLVLAPSASGRSRARRIAFHDGAHVGGTHHLALLNHPAVYELLRKWLSPPARG